VLATTPPVLCVNSSVLWQHSNLQCTHWSRWQQQYSCLLCSTSECWRYPKRLNPGCTEACCGVRSIPPEKLRVAPLCACKAPSQTWVPGRLCDLGGSGQRNTYRNKPHSAPELRWSKGVEFNTSCAILSSVLTLKSDFFSNLYAIIAFYYVRY